MPMTTDTNHADQGARAGDGIAAPFGWALVCNNGTTADFRPRVTDFFGAIQEREAFTAEDAARRDADWPGLAPHRIVALFGPAAAPAESPCKFAIDGGGNLYRRYREPVCAGCVPAAKETDKWESARVADFNAGWNACRVAMLAAAPAAAPAWQPIETAPKDEHFLAFKPGIKHFVARILDADHPDCEFDGGVHESWSHHYVDGVTHWMPLPAAPEIQCAATAEGGAA